MLSKNDIARRIGAATGVKPQLVKNVLDALTEVAAQEIEAGQDFTVPGIARISYTYRKPQKKGARWKKGETVTGFGGIEAVKEEDSPPVKAAVKLKASPTGLIARLKPGSKPEDQSAFLKSKAGRTVVGRKG